MSCNEHRRNRNMQYTSVGARNGRQDTGTTYGTLQQAVRGTLHYRRRLLSVNGSRTVERRQKLSRWRTPMRTSQISRNECDVVCGGSTARSYINLTWATGRQWRYHAAWGRAGAPPDHGQAPKFSRTFNALRSIASRKKSVNLMLPGVRF